MKHALTFWVCAHADTNQSLAPHVMILY